ncbi:MAG: glyoxalase [Chloroflexi bacterium]|nr:glyoxalase [Chloroflexota bacterium]
MNAQYRSAVLFVKDMAASRRFYEQLLGQQVEMDFGPNVGYTCGLSLWEVRAACEVIFQREPDTDAPLGRSNLETYFEVDDLDAAQQTLTEAGVRLVHPVIEQPWAQRTLRACDPDGHIVELSEPIDRTVRRLAEGGMNAAAISQKTAMPLPVVEQILAAGRPK